MKILLTNDDGIDSQPLSLVEDILSKKPDINLWIVSPSSDQSGQGTAITIPPNTMKINKISDQKYSVDGTPLDCVFLGINQIMDSYPDIIISGLALSYASHAGSTSLSSGTVSAGIASNLFNIPSIVITQEGEKITENTYAAVEKSIEYSINIIDKYKLHNTTINVNIPNNPTKISNEIKFAHKGYHKKFPFSSKEVDVDTYVYDFKKELLLEGTGSVESLADGYITITPLTSDNTDYVVLDLMLKSDYIS